ncbi:MAG TPA: MFS transporter [Chitinophagaceae bacterium]|nr:MFS transporter [Chitinophagaceae bacterium]
MSSLQASLPVKEKVFTPYQAFVIAVLSLLQFTLVLDFMVLSPLGAILLPTFHISTAQFGLVVSVYAFSAGFSGLMAAGFADKFDRKKLLLFFYFGFIAGTILCAIAPSYHFLLGARIITGLFGGVVGSVSNAIITDLFKMEVRGRVMGFVQMSFGAAQILGLPIGLVLANHFGWHAPFWMIAIAGIIAGLVIVVYMKPVDAHLRIKSERNPFQHLVKTLSLSTYQRAFLATTLLATGGYMLMPFGSAFSINNLGLTMDQLPLLYGISGFFSIVSGPLLGKASDKFGKFNLFVAGTAVAVTMVLVYTNLGLTPLWVLILINVILFMGITSRMISAMALMSAVPQPQDRGAFMSINASVQSVAGGIGAYCAGLLIKQTPSGYIEHYNRLGFAVTGSMLIVTLLLFRIDRYLRTVGRA